MEVAKPKVYLILVLMLVLAFSLGFLSGNFSRTVPCVDQSIHVFSSSGQVTASSIKVPAVNQEGEGSIIEIRVTSRPGTGKILTDIDSALFWVDTQSSIIKARKAADSLSEVDVNRRDLVYSADTTAGMLEGPSAGTALALVTLAALENITLNSSVMITGSINEDGTLGTAGGVEAKAVAARESGAKLFLIPQSYLEVGEYRREETCENRSGVEYCRTDYVPAGKSLEEETGIKIVRVENLEQALEYFRME